jgi:hypothetical protein
MRTLRIACLAIAAAFVVLALFGIGSASALTLCKENKTPCPKAQIYPKETVFSATVDENGVQFTGPVLTVHCPKGSTSVKFSEQSGNPMLGSMTSLSFEGCEGCQKVTAQSLPYASSLFLGSENEPLLSIENGGGGLPRLQFICLGVECTFGINKTELDVTGGKPAAVEANLEPAVLVAGNKTLCGASGNVTANYFVTEAVEPGEKGVANPPVWPVTEP